MTFRNQIFTAAALALLGQGLASPVMAEEGDLSSRVETLQQGQDEIRKELAEIKKLLQQGARAAAPSGPNVAGKIFNLGDNPAKGSSKAKVALIEFTDYQCPFCKRHKENTQPQIETEYVDSGKVRFVSLDMPLAMHPLAPKAAEAAHCGGDQGQYWELRDQLFENQRTLEPWNAHAEALGLDVAQYEECLNSGTYADAVKADIAEGSKAGVTGTPSFVVAVIDEKDPSKAKGLTFIRGAQQFAAFQAALDEAIESLN